MGWLANIKRRRAISRTDRLRSAVRRIQAASHNVGLLRHAAMQIPGAIGLHTNERLAHSSADLELVDGYMASGYGGFEVEEAIREASAKAILYLYRKELQAMAAAAQ